MPITDNNFTGAELQTVLTANPALFKEIQTAATALGHYAIPKDEYATFIEKERGTVAATKTKEIYDQLDNDILTTAGIPKENPQEKTYDYMKRALTTFKSKETTLAQTVADLQKQLKENAGDAAIKSQLDAATAALKDFQETKEPTYQKQLFAKDVMLDVYKGMQAHKLRTDLPEVLMVPALAAIEKQMVESARKDANGNIYYVDAQEKTILDGVKVATASKVLAGLLTELIDTGVKKPGGGSEAPGGPASATGVKNADGNDIVIPDTIKTKVALDEFLMSQGLTADSKEYNDLRTKYGEKLPLR